MSELVRERAAQGITLADQEQEEYAFDLNEFFAVNESGKFVHDADVDKFLDALTHQEKFPFSTPELRAELKHTFWLLNRVASAKALAKKLRLHPVFKDYEIVLAAGDGRLDDEDETEKSFDRVTQAIRQHEQDDHALGRPAHDGRDDTGVDGGAHALEYGIARALHAGGVPRAESLPFHRRGGEYLSQAERLCL
jgi:hypothetical protein